MLLMVRAVLVGGLFFLTSLVLGVLSFLRPFDPRNGLLFCHIVFPASLKLLGFKMVFRNIDQMWRSHPCVYVANHQSWIDVFTFGYLQRTMTISIGKSAIKFIPFFGWFYWLAGHILINRHHHESAMRTMKLAKTRLMERGYSIWMFPEGTRHRGALGPFKRGAFHLALDVGYKIQPLACSTLAGRINLNRWHSGTIIIEALPVVDSMGYTHEDIDPLIQVVRESMRVAVDRLNSDPEFTS